MPIINDSERSRTVDTNTGEYLRVSSDHWQDPYLHCVICAADGSPLFGANVERIAIDETGDRGMATLVRYIVREAWFPTGRPEKPTLFFGSHPMIARLREFLEVWRYLGGKKNPDPQFEFSDGREDREAVDERG